MLGHLLKLLLKFGAVAWLSLCGSLVETFARLAVELLIKFWDRALMASATRSSNSAWVMESMRGS